jgi:hypothetical protein
MIQDSYGITEEDPAAWSGAMKNIKMSLSLPRGLSEDIQQRLKQLIRQTETVLNHLST